MYIKRTTWFSDYDEYGEERLYSLSEFEEVMSEEDYLESLYSDDEEEELPRSKSKLAKAAIAAGVAIPVAIVGGKYAGKAISGKHAKLGKVLQAPADFIIDAGRKVGGKFKHNKKAVAPTTAPAARPQVLLPAPAARPQVLLPVPVK